MQQKLSGSPISGGSTEPSQKIIDLEMKQKELEKMLDDKDDQIEELIQEVNKLQEEKSSPFTERKQKHGHYSSSNMTSE